MPENIDAATEARLADVHAKNEVAAHAQETLSKLIESGALKESEAPVKGRFVAFLAPVEKNSQFLIQAGKVVSFPDKDSPFGQKLVHRDGDIFVAFHDGIAVFDLTDEEDVKRALWCEQNPNVCRNVSDPMTEAWAELKAGQQPLAGRDAVIPQSLDVDRALLGDPSGYSRVGSQAQRAREQLAESNAS